MARGVDKNKFFFILDYTDKYKQKAKVIRSVSILLGYAIHYLVGRIRYFLYARILLLAGAACILILACNEIIKKETNYVYLILASISILVGILTSLKFKEPKRKAFFLIASVIFLEILTVYFVL